MTKAKSLTHKAAIAKAREAGYATARYVGQAKDGTNIYICDTDRPYANGLPDFIKVRDGRAWFVDDTAEYDECFDALGDSEP